MKYDEAITYIYQLSKYGIKMGLKNITYLLNLLGNPHLKRKVIHIGGTNGKGSTAAMLSSILKAAGFKVGLYTSPHLVHFQERMKINESFISQEEVVQLLDRIKPFIQKVATTEGYQHPTFFEVITAMAYLYFHESNVDFAIMEVGLGGRLDATNVCQPLVSVISHIDYDHMDKLGNTLAEIAQEKGAIIKPGTEVINAAQFPEAQKEIEKIANQKNAKLFTIGQEIKASPCQSNLKGNLFQYHGIHNHLDHLHIPFIGQYQIENASLAIGVSELLNLKGYLIDKENIREGLEKSHWPGRFEIVQKDPLIILDGAHNPNGVDYFIQNLKQFVPNKKIIAVLGIFSDKNYQKIIRKIVPFVHQVILTMANNPRATPTTILAREAAKYIDRSRIIEKPTIDFAIKEAFKIAQKDDIICITGSLYTVGEAEAYFVKTKNIKKYQT